MTLDCFQLYLMVEQLLQGEGFEVIDDDFIEALPKVLGRADFLFGAKVVGGQAVHQVKGRLKGLVNVEKGNFFSRSCQYVTAFFAVDIHNEVGQL